MAPSEPSTSTNDAATTVPESSGRTLFKGRIQPPPRRTPYTAVTVQPVLPESKITATDLRAPKPEVVYVNSTDVCLPFLEPDRPGGQQSRDGRSA
ncbi:uncharacterized protein SPSK_00065 [Sporothrix schenckii 1099-18]|uniref:Uncharacterized protein n=1 Tax=Sporothrix schenckii 1099-18 TaxID=1397361 RepID=A0A0F2LTI9_SPOSC|nr:uncharacterized protein SPSK_00065 [Sporothrix schenckii 1099-18]KJR79840.1 hypothetical protein SPSK_00065 [Sporothrix schenckii 1099-18]